VEICIKTGRLKKYLLRYLDIHLITVGFEVLAAMVQGRVLWMFRRNISPPSSVSKSKRRSYEWKIRSCWFLAWLTLRKWRWTPYIPPKSRTISELNDITTHKTVHFIRKLFEAFWKCWAFKQTKLVPIKKSPTLQRIDLRLDTWRIEVWFPVGARDFVSSP
jgi:hypothetical protein